MKKINLSQKQNSIIYCLQNGWKLLTDRDNKTIVCYTKNLQFEFSKTIFGNLLQKQLIEQQLSWPFDFTLTELGRGTKTAPVEFKNHFT